MDGRIAPHILKWLRMAALPLVVLSVQCFSNTHTGLLLFLLVLLFLVFKRARKETLLLVIMICGYLIWLCASSRIETAVLSCGWDAAWITVFSRFGLLGYLVLFFMWNLLERTHTIHVRTGDWKAPIQLPFIWYGKTKTVWRFAIGFSLSCIVLAGAWTYANRSGGLLFPFGVAFACVNAILEELLWRGFVLDRTSGLFGEKSGLIVMSAAFGLSHLSLGFSVPVCLLFSLGGFYFGGVALRSQGLLAPIVMHISMNVLFVAMGVIF